MEPLTTTSAVIEALGGTAKVARLTGRTMQAVSNWKDRGFFTAATYDSITQALTASGRRAEMRLWRSVPASAAVGASEAA